MPAWRMKPGVGASGSPTQNGSTSGLPRPSFTSSRIFEAVSARTAARAVNGVSNFTGYSKLPADASSAHRLDPRLRLAVHGPLFGVGPRPAPRVHDRGPGGGHGGGRRGRGHRDRKSTRLNSSHRCISYAVFCLKKKKQQYKYEHNITDRKPQSVYR